MTAAVEAVRSSGTAHPTRRPRTPAADWWASLLSRLPWYAVPLGIFALTRLVDVVLLLHAGQHQLLRTPSSVPIDGLPTSYFSVVTDWDGRWYRQIAEHGYPSTLPHTGSGEIGRNAWAFYPLYPALVRVVGLIGLPYGVAASLVSLVAGAGAMVVLYRMVETTSGDRFTAGMTTLGLCSFASASIFQSGYPESLTLLLVLASLWALRERRYGVVLCCGLLLAVTRPIALPLAAVVAMHGFLRWRRRRTEPFSWPQRRRLIGLVGVLAASSALWPLVAAVRTGVPDAYFLTQRAWVHGDDSGWPSWLHEAVSSGWPSFTILVLCFLVVLGIVVGRPAARVWGFELRAWAVVYALYILATTWPGSSVVRHLMLMVVPWWPVPDLGRRLTTTRSRLVAVVVVASVGLMFRWLWIGDVWTPTRLAIAP